VRIEVRKEYKARRGYPVSREPETVRVHLIRKLAEMIDGVDLSKAQVGDILTLPRRDGELLLAERWAEICNADAVAEAADLSSAVADPSGSAPWPVPGRTRRLLRRRPVHTSHARDGYQWIASVPVNVMLIGPRTLTREILKGVRRKFEGPVVDVTPGASLTLPSPGSTGTVLLDDVERLTLDDQRRLFDWLGSIPTHTRVVCTSTRPLINLLRRGAFLDGLYYRLNTLCIPIASRTA